MLLLDASNALLQEIKIAVENTAKSYQAANTKAPNTWVMTDRLRQDILRVLVTYSDRIPHPASGFSGAHESQSLSLVRWQILAYVASIDLTIAKWFESHLDALSILHEVGHDKAVEGLWAVWAAEGHPDPLRYEQGKVTGTKAWCSGANMVDHGLMTYRDQHGDSQLLMVNMDQAGIETDNEGWQAVGMQATDTATIQFQQVAASQVGPANSYLNRVGFWHGAAGVAACWYGAAAGIAAYLSTSYQKKPHDYKAMYLGQTDTALAVTQQYFHHVAALIDSQPQQDHERIIRELRSHTEMVVRQVLDIAGQALGAAPFCGSAHFARLSADLAVFIRQSHGAFDLQKIGELTGELTNKQENIWQL